MSTEQLKVLEANIKIAKEVVELGQSLERLFNNRDFKKVIISGYFEKEAVRLVHAKASVENQTEAMQKSIITQIDSIGLFHKYLSDIATSAALASKTLNADEQTRDELLSEDI